MADISRIRVDSTTYDLKDARLPAPGADGTGLVSVNGEWVQTPGYGYSVTEDSFVLGEFTSADFTQEGTEYKATIPLTSELLTLLQRMFTNHEEFNVTIDGTTYNSVADQFTYTDDPSIYLQDVFRLEPNSNYTALTFFVPTAPSSARIYGSVTTYTQFDRRLLPEQELNVKNGTGNGSIVVSGNDEPSFNKATGNHSVAEGYATIAGSSASHTEGYYSMAVNGYTGYGSNSNSNHSEGFFTASVGLGSHSEGSSDYYVEHIYITGDENATELSYGFSTGATHQLDNRIIGVYLIYSGEDADLEGTFYRITGLDSSRQIIQVSQSHPAFSNTSFRIIDNFAVGDGAHTEGEGTQAFQDSSHAEGLKTIANGEAQHVQGKYNIEDTNSTYAHIVGNGTNTARSNAHTLDWNGNAWYAGTVSAGTVDSPAPVTNANDLATKAYVDANAGGDSPVESGTGNGSVQSKSYIDNDVTYTQQATGVGATALGGNTTASAAYAFAEGLSTVANGKASHAEGSYEKNIIVVSGSEGTRRLTVSSSTYPVTAGDIGKAIQNLNGGYRYLIVDVKGSIITINSDILSSLTNETLQIAPPGTSGSYASGIASHKEGYTTIASGAFAHAEGSTAWASGVGAHAEGIGSKAAANAAHAEGRTTYARNEASHAEGFDSKALGTACHAEGYYSYAYGDYSHTEGNMTLTSYESKNAHAEGILTVAHGNASHAEGAGNLVSSLTLTGDTNDGYVYPQSQASTANTLKRGDALYTFNGTLTPSTRYLGIVGYVDQANRKISLEDYDGSNALDNEPVRMIRNVAYGSYSHSEGYDCKAFAIGSHAEGSSTVAGVDTLIYYPGDEDADPYTYEDVSGLYSHAEGSSTYAYGSASHAGGSNTYAIGNDSFATNSGVVAYGQSSTAFGYSLTETVMSLTGTSDPSIYNYSGYPTVEVGMIGYLNYNGLFCAHAVTDIDRTNHRITFDGAFNIAENETQNVSFKYGGAVGENSFIEGYQTSAIGKNAHAEGYETIALGDNQHAFGVLNERDENGNYAIIVGNGTPEDDSHPQTIRSNAYTLDWSGNGWFAGNITANGGSLTLHDSTGDVTVTAAQLRQLLAMLS